MARAAANIALPRPIRSVTNVPPDAEPEGGDEGVSLDVSGNPIGTFTGGGPSRGAATPGAIAYDGTAATVHITFQPHGIQALAENHS